MDTKLLPDSVSSDTPDLICVVCGDKANGMHYRALTCEGCKTFFRRNARHRDTLKCEMMSESGCEMDMYTRRHCAACRMKKCISVGMQPDRLWDKDRLATRKPIKKKVKVKPESQEPNPVTERAEALVADLMPELIAEHLKLGELIAQAYRSAKDTLPAPPPNVIPTEDEVTDVKIQKSASARASYAQALASKDIDAHSRHESSAPSSSEMAFVTSETSTRLSQSSLPARQSTSPSPQRTHVHGPSSLTSPQRSMSMAHSSSHHHSSLISSTHKLKSSSLDVGGISSTQGPLSCPPPALPHSHGLNVPGTSKSHLDEADAAVRAVRRCECGCIIHNKPDLSHEEVELTKDKAPVRTDLPLKALPTHQPHSILQSPVKSMKSILDPGPSSSSAMFQKGDDGEDRLPLAGGLTGQVIVPQIMEVVILLLRHMINFAKQLPGFQALTSDDQATLIKGALVEYLILTSCPLYDIEKKKFNSEIWPTLSVDPDQVESAGFITLMGSVMSFAVKMQKLSLKDEELALLYSLAIMSPDRRDLTETTKVEELQQPLVDALQTCVQINHPNRVGHFAKIIMLLTEVRNATEAYMEDLMSIQLSGNKLNPLLEELFSS